MDRRRFLSHTAAASAVATVAACGPGPGNGRRNTGESRESGPGIVTRPRLRWRLASSFPGALDVIYGGAVSVAERVRDLTGGRFEIEVFEAGEIVPALQVLDAVQSGSVELGHTAGYYSLGKNPALVFDTTLPFGMNARQHDAWVREGGGEALIARTLADFGIVGFPAGNTGVQMGGWFREPVRSLGDLRGLRMRIPGLGARVMERLGVIAQTIPGGEIYQALERGAIDATEWVGPYDDTKLGFHEVVQTYHYPGWWEPSATLSLYVNRAAWDGLPSEYQAAIRLAAADANATMLHRYDARNPEALAALVDGDVRLVPFPEDVMRAASVEARALVDETAADADDHYRALLASYRAFQAASDRWLGSAELAMARFAATSPASAPRRA
ncbi:MAG: TRAP transporter substrate-binding protein DctP [Bacteroidota bacterium]